MTKERRRAERQNWLRLESKVHIKRSLFKKEWIPVVPFDFSQYGMGIQTDEVYHLNDEVALSLSLIEEDRDISIALIKGYVRYKEKHHSRFNYGVEFYFASNALKLSMENELLLIEQTLRQYESQLESGCSDVVNGA